MAMTKTEKRAYHDAQFKKFNATVTEYPDAGLRAGTYDYNGKYALLVFAENKKSPLCHFAFSTPARRDEYLDQVLDKARDDKAAAQARRMMDSLRAQRFAAALKPGDIMASSWGWEQTNVDFYEVVDVRGMTVALREIGRDIVGTGFMSGKTTPRPGEYKGKTFTRRVLGCGDVPTVNIRSFASARLWDGKPHYVSWYA